MGRAVRTTSWTRPGRAVLSAMVMLACVRLASARAGTGRDAISSRVVLPVTGRAAEVLKKLGRRHFMLGVVGGLGDRWIEETRPQGCRWDMRYQYLAGGVNRPHNWKNWNLPTAAFVELYLREARRTGVVPVFSWYQMLQSLPGGGGGEAAVNKANCENVSTMRQYFSDLKLFMQKAAQHDGPVVFHVEPDLWGHFLIAPEFRPNDPDRIRVIVKSTGLTDLAEFDDTVIGFGRAIAALRDRYAPNVLLGWHASKWGHPSTRKYADVVRKCGNWDIIFVDPSDRDAGWKLAHGYHVQGAWWNEADFASFRDWSGELHRLTGLPLVAWQIPVGNTIMAACDNTDGHYMDNRVEHWLEGYPANTSIVEWAKRGFIALLFGGGAAGCTSFRDGRGDGFTNPAPVEGNRGERSRFADDDGGYLRLRGARYYGDPLLMLSPDELKRLAKRRLTVAKPEPTREEAAGGAKVAAEPRDRRDWGRRLVRSARPVEEKPSGPKDDPAAKLYHEAETVFIDGDIDRARKLFDKLASEHPESEYAAKAREYLAIIE